MGNVVMESWALTDQAGQQQVAEESEQRPHTWRDEVAQRCRLRVRVT